MLNNLFVYGTLKKGHLRSRMWPRAPQTIRLALARGRLLDLGAYPGLIPGEDWVLGELWTLASEHVLETLEVLDQVEGYDSATDRGLYVRREIPVWLTDPMDRVPGTVGTDAYTYLIADQQRIAEARQIPPWVPVGDRFASQWPDSRSRVPARLEDE